MSLELQGLLMTSDSSVFSVWTAIDTLFLNNKHARQVYMLADLYDQKQLQSFASIYVAKIKHCADGLHDAGKTVPGRPPQDDGQAHPPQQPAVRL